MSALSMLVCLAASVSMILVNLLLGVTGKSSGSFVTLDLMRLPLGILSGMGFIGGGAILRRGNIVRGVTTAATLWFVTVIGLCFGGGQIALGFAVLVVGFGTLTGLKSFEKRCKVNRRATLAIVAGPRVLEEIDVEQAFAENGFKIVVTSAEYTDAGQLRELNCEVRWQGRADDRSPPAFLKEFVARRALQKFDWQDAAKE